MAGLQDTYATKSYIELYEIFKEKPSVLKVWEDIFDAHTYGDILKMILKIQMGEING